MASHAEKAVRQGVEALMKRDAALARQVKEDDELLDALEIEVDDMAIHLLAKAPLASDLRLITTAMKISQNLERVGDEATKIAKRTCDLVQHPPLKQAARIPSLASLSLELLKAALDAFVSGDSAAARSIVPRDKQVDEMNRDIYRELVELMMSDSASVACGLDLIVVAKCLERIADHAKNIAEEVVYLREAEDIRHAGKTDAQSAGPEST